jgi:hypothetical protein
MSIRPGPEGLLDQLPRQLDIQTRRPSRRRHLLRDGLARRFDLSRTMILPDQSKTL